MVALLAIGSVLACMVAKMFLALQTKAMEKKLNRTRDVFHEARREQGEAAGKIKLLDAECRHLEAKKKRSTQKIDTYGKSLNGFAQVEQKEREKAQAQAQQELVQQANERK
jgi:uncharacterized protein YlxW (UPF0749 family)